MFDHAHPSDDVMGYPSDDVTGYPSDDVMGYPSDDVMGYPSDDVMGYPSDDVMVPLYEAREPVRCSDLPAHAPGHKVGPDVVLPGSNVAGDQTENVPPITYTMVPPSCGKPRAGNKLLKKSKKVFNSPYLASCQQPVAGLLKTKVSKSDLPEASGTVQVP